MAGASLPGAHSHVSASFLKAETGHVGILLLMLDSCNGHTIPKPVSEHQVVLMDLLSYCYDTREGTRCAYQASCSTSRAARMLACQALIDTSMEGRKMDVQHRSSGLLLDRARQAKLHDLSCSPKAWGRGWLMSRSGGQTGWQTRRGSPKDGTGQMLVIYSSCASHHSMRGRVSRSHETAARRAL